MAEVTNVADEVLADDVAENAAPNIDDVLEQLASERARAEKAEAESKRLKAANDKLSKNEAEKKRQDRERMTAEELKAEEMRLAQEKIEKENEDMKAELNKIKAQSAYSKVFSDEKVIENLIESVNDKDHNAIATIFEKLRNTAVDTAVKEKQAEWMKNRPPVNAGIGSGTMTKDEFNNMGMAEKSKMYRENKAEYDRLSKL